MRGGNTAPPIPPWKRSHWPYAVCPLSLQELQEHVREGIGLRQHGGGRLGEHLIAHKGGHLRGHVHIRDAGFRRLQALGLHAEVGHRIFQPILHRAKMRTDLILADDGVIQPIQGPWASSCVLMEMMSPAGFWFRGGSPGPGGSGTPC